MERHERVAYRPQIDMQQIQAFDEHLRTLPGSWSTIGRSFVHSGAPGVIRLRWQIANERWCDEPGFLDFLDVRNHRLLLRCFLQHEPMTEDLQPSDEESDSSGAGMPEHDWQRSWTEEALLKKMEPGTKQRHLTQALHFLEIQGYIVAHGPGEWVSGSFLEQVMTLAPTFSWCVQARLQTNHHALVRRSVSFIEWQNSSLNELDVLAFMEDGRIMIVDCKTNPAIPLEQMIHFVRRASEFPADISLLLIDTDDEEQVIKRLRQMNTILHREETDFGSRYQHKGSTMYHLTENLYVANTAGGISSVLELALQSASSLKPVNYIPSL
jgi:hypothetical protein